MDERELTWNDYRINVDLHRSYLDLAIKINMLSYAITGAIISFHFSNFEHAVMKIALALPPGLHNFYIPGKTRYGAIKAAYCRYADFFNNFLNSEVSEKMKDK